ncbi:hypothetical protein GTP56_07710 [Duganella sp. FT134W]|uniref:Transposase IS200-like domain-containing protein n=1 Tax=Duganella margarita TaxID=2692170 RepID=A0A7X4KF71_9BURK|nr:transposase [Duganella margarita]MYM72081.1 hypothetical protein [Duganella margarita]
MTRPLRLEFPGALYHETSRGNRKALIYHDDTDRLVWLQTLKDVCAQFRFSVYSFCQMGNHYHLLVETLDGNLPHGMRQLNGVYSQYFNRRHDLVATNDFAQHVQSAATTTPLQGISKIQRSNLAQSLRTYQESRAVKKRS